MRKPLRNLALYCPELEPGRFIWMILESVDDPHDWDSAHDHEGFNGEMFDSFEKAWAAGTEALFEFMRTHPYNSRSVPIFPWSKG
jgi:hypothetical protein